MNTPITDANVKCIPILDPDGEGTLRMKSIVEPDVCREIEQQAGRLAGALSELVQAMVDYQMDVDDPPPFKHRDMMERARKELAAWKEGKA